MRIAYLILCHKNAKQVNLLLQELLCDGDCYVHIDKKSRIRKGELITSKHIFYVSETKRVDVRWTSNSMIRATLELIDLLLERNEYYEYVCLLSGQDFPIKSMEERQQYLNDNNGMNYIEVLPHNNAYFKRYEKRNRMYYPSYMFRGTYLTRALRKLFIISSGGWYHTMWFLRRNNGSGLSFEYGSQWWCLTYECVKWMQQFIKECVNVDYFDHSLTPDECFFQSVFMASPYKDKRKDKVVFLEWAADRNHPRVFRTEDYDLLQKQEDKLFARKFDITIDNIIIEMLTEKLNISL